MTFVSVCAPQDPQINSAGVRVAELCALPCSSFFSWCFSELLLLEAGLRQAPSPDLVVLPRSKAADLCLAGVCALAGLTCVSRERGTAGPGTQITLALLNPATGSPGAPAPCTALHGPAQPCYFGLEPLLPWVYYRLRG